MNKDQREMYMQRIEQFSTDAMRSREAVRVAERELERLRKKRDDYHRLLMDAVKQFSEDRPSMEDHYEGTNIKLL